MTIFHPRGLIGKIYVGTTRHTKYISYNLVVLEDIFYVFPIISLWELLIHMVWPVRIPGDLCCGALDAAT